MRFASDLLPSPRHIRVHVCPSDDGRFHWVVDDRAEIHGGTEATRAGAWEAAVPHMLAAVRARLLFDQVTRNVPRGT